MFPKNILFGILISCIITFSAFAIYPYFALIFFGDIYLIIGTVIGTIFSLKNRKQDQSHIKTAIIVGIGGACLSSILISLLQWVFYILDYGFNIVVFFLYLFNFLPFYLILALIVGYLIGYYYSRSEENTELLSY